MAKKRVKKRKQKDTDTRIGLYLLIGVAILYLFDFSRTVLTSTRVITGVGLHQEPIVFHEVEAFFDPVPIVSEPLTIEQLICQPKYKWDCNLLIAVAKSENGYEMYGGWKPDAVFTGNSNGSVDTGILMVNSIHGYAVEFLKVAENNIEVGYKIWLSQGYSAWSDYNNGRYLRYY